MNILERTTFLEDEHSDLKIMSVVPGSILKILKHYVLVKILDATAKINIEATLEKELFDDNDLKEGRKFYIFVGLKENKPFKYIEYCDNDTHLEENTETELQGTAHCKCGSSRLVRVLANCPSDFYAYQENNQKILEGTINSDLNIGERDTLKFKYCLDCGQIQNWKKAKGL